MKKFITSYYLTHDNGEKYKFGQHIFAIDQEEAEYFVKYCPNTKMDGDHDGVPCEGDSRF